MSSQPVPVEACVGWTSPCSFCDKRFSNWISIEDEDAISTVPNKAGVFVFAFETKRGKEVVSISVHRADIQTSVAPQLKDLKRQIAQKKSKESKVSILLRYVVWDDVANKDACTLYAHWQNHGILPRLVSQWPGTGILKNSQELEFVDENQKWCYPVKDPVWRKKKSNVTPMAVSKCKGWDQNCAYCDSKFTIWLPVEEATSRKESDGGAPERTGFVVFCANKQGKRHIVAIFTDSSIKNSISINSSWIKYSNKKNKTLDPESTAEVRWMTVHDVKDLDSCLMYAHFLNYGKDLSSGKKLEGNEILANNAKFSFRHSDKQWCYDEGQSTNARPVKKVKERRELLRSMLDELHTDET